MASFKDLKKGSILGESQYYCVQQIKGDKIQLKNSYGDDIVVDKGYVEKCLVSADQFTKTETITKTAAAELLISNSGVVMQVLFSKAVKEVDVVSEIMGAYESSTPKTMAEAVRKAVKTAIQGEDRLITGYHMGNVSELGRVQFVDMEIEKDEKGGFNQMRQIDPRTIKFIILRDVKYVVK